MPASFAEIAESLQDFVRISTFRIGQARLLANIGQAPPLSRDDTVHLEGWARQALMAKEAQRVLSALAPYEHQVRMLVPALLTEPEADAVLAVRARP